ncbi:sorting nexin-14-like isoform X3 [Biomphalaria glabrata]|uniref:Sorting nexin-14-like isoform X3 n=1 Tax=Biomphalaria glabrata TaxID=6526 RepID=A0A9W2ZS37_BIOGL|nr:sorting nexin-14-like isoform X3 [Biomphalaria glabrata]
MIPWYLLKFYAQRHSKFTASCIVLLIINLLFYNLFHIFLILWVFIIGVIFAYSLLSPISVLPNLLPIYSKKSKHKNLGDDELTLMKTVCTVCGLRRCPRHRPELNILAFQPWTNLDIHKSVDDALHEFFNIVLKEFVYTWYRELSEDEEFVDELRTNFRFLASVMFRRMKKLDVPELVTKRLLRASVQHIDLCVQAYKEADYKGDIQQIVLDFMGSNVHCAMWSRKAELEYLRRLVESLFPYILRPQALNSSACFTEADDYDMDNFVPVLKSTCALVRELLAGAVLLPTLDAIANPDLINNLLLVFFDKTPPPQATEPPSPMVPFLGQFSQARARNQSCLRLELKDVINPECPELLYPFMQFLKSEAAVNVLQFCLACSDFNRRILNPDASQSEFSDLHSTVKDLYNVYCAPNALDRIKFDDDIVETLREVVEGPPDQVIKLRTSAPLFKAYEHAYNLLENNFLPMFHQSDDYYSMICGDRPNALLTKQMSSFFGGKLNSLRQTKKKDFTLAQFGNKLKDVFKSADERLSNNIEPALDGMSLNSVSQPSVCVEEELEDSSLDCDHSMHDLSSWRVTIPRIGARPDPENPRKQYFVFIIDIRRLDVEEGEERKQQWTVARRYAEFYVLEQKLTEFHGELLECQLPAKKSFGTNKHDFTEGKKSDFENYLQKLLTKPHLRNSELLYQFLTSEHEFSTSFLPGIKLGKFVKTKLVKEKGQHLDEFLVTFATSTEASKPKSSKLSRRGSDTSLMSTSSDKLSGTHFDNNMNFGFQPPSSKRDLPHQVKDIDGAFDYLLFLLKNVFRAPEWFMGLMFSARILLKETVENYLDYHIEYKLSQVTQEHRLVGLVNLLKEILFFDDDPPRSDEDKRIRYASAYKELLDFLPDVLHTALGNSNTREGCELLLQIFQQPKLNKQLSYVLLDIVVQELFPELK